MFSTHHASSTGRGAWRWQEVGELHVAQEPSAAQQDEGWHTAGTAGAASHQHCGQFWAPQYKKDIKYKRT